MRVSIVSIILTGGVLALGACAPIDTSPMTLAERTEYCERLRSGLQPTGSSTGDARQDYRCQPIHATAYGHGRQNSDEGVRARDKILRSGG